MLDNAHNQRLRLLGWLKKYKRITTVEARAKLNILHPPARILELRRSGCNIITNWATIYDNMNQAHRVGEYILKSDFRI